MQNIRLGRENIEDKDMIAWDVILGISDTSTIPNEDFKIILNVSYLCSYLTVRGRDTTLPYLRSLNHLHPVVRADVFGDGRAIVWKGTSLWDPYNSEFERGKLAEIIRGIMLIFNGYI